jgi:large repetitive protein
MTLYHKLILLLVCLQMFCIEIFAQQNCMDAIPICQNVYTQSNANAGVGSVADLTSSNQGCLTNGEVNASWYILNTSTSGNILFTITPNAPTDDYDFAVWDITDTSCAALANGLTPLRCNFASLANSSVGGLTGLNNTATQTTLGGAGPSFCSAITASAGQTFIILVNNNTASTNGYTINFSGSTAQIIDNTLPSVKSVTVPPACGGPTQVKVLLKENVKCSSIAINGSDFSINGGAAIVAATGSSCPIGGVFSSSIYINFTTALLPANYTVTINNGIDGNTLIDNCSNALAAGTTFTFTVLPPVRIIANPQFGCSGSTSGTITAFGTGGYAPYKYKINAGVFNVGNTFSSLTAGTYTVYIKDSLGCIDDTIISLSAAPPIVLNSISSTNLSCFNATNGTITINASGGNVPLNYAVNSATYSANNVIANLSPGTYVVHTKDANGCIKDSIILISAPGDIVGFTVAISNVSCIGLSNGSIQYVATGGTLPLQYALNTSGYSAFANFTNLPIGIYTLHIKDANNCTKDTVITITQPLFVLSASIINLLQPNCSGTTGTINAIGNGGTPPYSYSINGTSYSVNNSFTNLSSGTYSVYVKDAGGCIATITALLSSPGNLSFTGATITQPTCVVGGSILITAAGSAIPLSFAIGNGGYSSTFNFTSLQAGSYTLHVKDINNCIHDTIINLLNPALPQMAISAVANATCSVPTAGVISVVANGGTGAFTYSFNGGSYIASSTFTNLAAGFYTIIVKDANGCTATAAASVATTNSMAFGSAIVTNVGCGGSPLGSIVVQGIGGNTPYQYQLNANAFQASNSFASLIGGVYSITVKDASGCTKSTILLVQTSAAFSITSLTKTNASCSNPGNGTISVAVLGGVPNVVYNLNGINYPNTNFNSLSPGTYTFTATDANGCSVSSTTIITGPPKLWFTNTTLVLPPCYGGIGSIITNGIGGAPPYTYSLNTNAYTNAANYSPLSAGTYTVHLQDANGCLHDTVITIIQPSPVLANNLIVNNAGCTGIANGSISVTGGGTVGPFQYNLNNGTWGATNTFSNLAVGTYTVGVKDLNGCTGTIVASINNNGNFYFNTSSYVLPTCIGVSNGSVTFSGTGGTTPFTYKINNGAYQASNTFSALTAGAYTLYVKDNTGCIVSQVINLPNPNSILYNLITLTSPLCFNGNNGSINVNVGGGAGGIVCKLDGGVYNSIFNFTNLLSGTHTISCKDANGCVRDTIINIANPLPIIFNNITIVNPGCFGPGNGSITVLGSGGVTPYLYKFNANAYSSNNSFNPLLAGAYTVSITDANNCTNSTIINLTNSTGVVFNQVNISLPLCPNSSNGSINVVATSANNPCVYNINGGANVSNGLFTNLGIGTFSIHATDALGCYKDTVVTLVTQSNLKIDSAKFTKVLCFGDSTGTATLFASGGSGAITYSYNANAYQVSNTIIGLTNTTYTLHAKDAIGCIVDTVLTIGAPLPLYFASSSLTSPYCNGSQDGIISIGAGGGTAPYQYSINTNPLSTANVYNNLIQGIYTFHIQDAHGCMHDTSMFLQGPDIVYFASFTLSNITCFGASDGSVLATAAGGLAPYQYALNNNAFSTVNLFSNLPVGNYTLLATDNQGCIKDTDFIITAPVSNIALQIINITNNQCRGDSNGSISVMGSGGTSPYQFSFNAPNAFGSVMQFNNLYASAYSVFIKDANGCSVDTIISVLEPDSSAQIVLIGTTINSCIGVYDATLTVSAKNGFSPYKYLLNGSLMGTDSIFYNLFSGDYVVEVIDSIGCKSTGKYFVDSTKRQPFITINALQNNVCKYDIAGSVSWQYIDAYSPVLASINGSAFTNVINVNALASGNYTLQIKDAKGCLTDTTFAISYYDSLSIIATAQEATCSSIGNDGKANVSTNGGSAPYIYTWSIPTANNTNAIQNLTFGTYSIVVIDSAGCADSTNFVVGYYPCCNMWMPNVFSPNKDNVNDHVIVIPSGPAVFISLDIYNRFGNHVFSTKDINTRWNGMYKNEPCELSTYFYILKYNCPLTNKDIIKKGDITLIR